MAKLLLDECIPHGLRFHLQEFEAYTVTYMGWSGLKNGELMKTAVAQEFDVLLTIDKNLRYQQNMHKYALAIVVFDVVKLELEYIELLLPKFFKLLPEIQKGQVYILD